MPNMAVIDSGPCIALFNRDDDYHKQATRFVKRTPFALISTLAVVTEVMYLLDFSVEAQKDFLLWVTSGAITLIEPENADLERTATLMHKYSDLPMDFTDGLLVAICERLEIKNVASVDDDFTIYRFKGRGKFKNVFFDD